MIEAVGVASGAAIGALLRWWLNVATRGVHSWIPLGTLAANLIGGYLIGLAVGWFSKHPDMNPALRLFCITGFLGGLTTFSSFSAECVALLSEGELGRAVVLSVLHLAGSLILTYAGLKTYAWLTA